MKKRLKSFKKYKINKKLLIIILFACLFLENGDLDYIKYNYLNIFFRTNIIENIKFDKWIVITVFNPPSSSIFKLEKTIRNYKIVIIGNNQSNDKEWGIFNSSKVLFYLSIKQQKSLKYRILKYLKPNSYFRKSIGYLFAIQKGAKEIYEIDEELEFNSNQITNHDFDKKYISYVSRNDNLMINPYPHFGYSKIWPRGFKINDIGRQTKNNFYLINSTNLFMKPLIFQGIINLYPDIDSIFSSTSIKLDNIYDFKISNANPLLYFPNNFIPINSKNTHYLYDIFPLLMFPISLNENIADIWRGYLMQYFAWIIKGGVIYHISEVFRMSPKRSNVSFQKEKKNFFLLNKLINFLEMQNVNNLELKKNTLELLNEFLNKLIDNNFFEKKDKDIYQAYLKDLKDCGYDFSIFCETKGNMLNNSNYLKIKSEFKFYIPSSMFIVKGSNITLMNHYYSNKIYKDILLIINYNHDGFSELNDYITNLYNNTFPNIIFINPSITNKSNIIFCNSSNAGYYSYNCFNNVYHKYPNFQGYLYINDDLFVKFWELENLNFSFPWLNPFRPISKNWFHYSKCLQLYNIFNKTTEWKNNIVSFNGFYEIILGMSDFFYLPNYYASKISNIFDEMFKYKIYLECAVPTSMGILFTSKYEIITISALWGKERKYSIIYLFKKFDRIMFHPIKLSNKLAQKKVIQFISFISASEF